MARTVWRAATMAAMALMFMAGSWLLPPARPAHAAVTSVTMLQREQYVMNWAISQAGKPYIWGGTGPYGYDCSGLVYAAFRRYGITLPRTTYGMLGSWHLVRVYTPRRGDLAFFGSGHVEFVTTWYRTTFGAAHSGTLLGWHRWYPGSWQPSAFFRVR